MKVKAIKSTTKTKFERLFKTVHLKINQKWEHNINKILENHFNYSVSNSFWYIGDFRIGNVIDAGGDILSCTPWDAKKWIGLDPMAIAKLIHPDDVQKMQSYIFYVAGYFAQKKNQKEIDNVKVSLIFRMLNSNNNYTWRIMTYPKVYYASHQPVLLLAIVSDYDHAHENQTCKMFMIDKNTNLKTLFYVDDTTTELNKFKNDLKLSTRELEVLFWLSKGLLSKEVGAKLAISKNTVENHKQNIFKKTGTKNIAELIDFANKNKLV